MRVHVQRISRISFYQLRQLRSVRRSLSVNACTALVHAFVTSRLDYCNSLLAGIGDGLIDQLQTAWCEWRPVLSSGSVSSIQSRQTFVIVYTGSPSVQESTSSWVFLFTSVSMVSLLHTSWRCLYWNQLFRPSLVFARRRQVISLCRCREQKQKRLGHEASPLLGPPSGTVCLTIWGTLPWVYLFSNKDWNRICLNNVDVWYSLNWHLPPHSS